MNKIFFRKDNEDLNINFWNFKDILKNVKLLFYSFLAQKKIWCWMMANLSLDTYNFSEWRKIFKNPIYLCRKTYDKLLKRLCSYLNDFSAHFSVFYEKFGHQMDYCSCRYLPVRVLVRKQLGFLALCSLFTRPSFIGLCLFLWLKRGNLL